MECFFFAFFVDSAYSSCPVFIDFSKLASFLGPHSRQQIRLFARTSEHFENWSELPLQFVHTKDGKLHLPREVDWIEKPGAQSDRLLLNVAKFGFRYREGALPCSGKLLAELKSKNGFGYLMACSKPKKEWNSPVSFEPEKAKIVSPRYVFNYRADNPLLFNSLFLKAMTGKQTNFVSGSQIHIRAILNSFLHLDFDSDDFVADIMGYQNGAIGLLGKLSFSLKLLGFEIDLQLHPEAYFFEHSVMIPMLLTMPFNAQSLLESGSGFFYSWESASGVRWKKNSLPPFGQSHADWEKIENRYCSSVVCTFSLSGKMGMDKILFRLILDRETVRRGFFPQLVGSSTQLQEQGNLADDIPPDSLVLFFDTSELEKGKYYWHLWVRLVGDSDSTACPASVNLSPFHHPVRPGSGQ